MKQLILYGSASQKIIKTFELENKDIDDESLLQFLMKHKIPIASSCLGEGICKKCVVTNHDKKLLACTLSLSELFSTSDSETLSFSYL